MRHRTHLILMSHFSSFVLKSREHSDGRQNAPSFRASIVTADRIPEATRWNTPTADIVRDATGRSTLTADRVSDATGWNTLTADGIPDATGWNTLTAVRVLATTAEALSRPT